MDELQSFNIRARAVLRDSEYKFRDGESKPKWIVILSDNLIEESIIFTLTTSQVKNYLGSRKPHMTTDLTLILT